MLTIITIIITISNNKDITSSLRYHIIRKVPMQLLLLLLQPREDIHLVMHQFMLQHLPRQYLYPQQQQQELYLHRQLHQDLIL